MKTADCCNNIKTPNEACIQKQKAAAILPTD